MFPYLLIFPEDYEDYAWEVESKGWFGEARLEFSGRSYRLNFYEPVRHRQEVESELLRRDVFFEPNLIIVPLVSKLNMEKAVEFLVRTGQVNLLVAE
jgi:hypothetical protein